MTTVDTDTISLLSHYNLGDLELRNRLVMAPMTRSRTPGYVPNDLNALYYAQRASAGLIVTESTNVSVLGNGGPYTPGIFTEEQAAGWKKVTDAVHEKDGKIFVQLWHAGRVAHPDNIGGLQPVGPSPIPAEGKAFTPEGFKPYVTPRELSVAEIQDIIEQFRSAALMAKDAGFDGVELHAAFGYLPNQFLSDVSNQRTDAYGGSIPNRCRFVLEVMDALCSVWPSQRVGIRIAPSNLHNSVLDSDPPALYDYLIRQLDRRNLAYLSVMEAPASAVPPHERYLTEVTAFARQRYHGTLITNGNLNRQKARQLIENDQADLVAFGQLFIANPDLPERFALNAPLTSPDHSKYYGGGAAGYTDYLPLQSE